MKFSSTRIPRKVIPAFCARLFARLLARHLAPLLATLLATQSFGALADADNEVPSNNDAKIEEVLVLANHLPTNANNIGSSISSIDTNDFARQAHFDVSQLLRTIPNMSVNRAGSLGALTQVRIRGAEANHTLVLIDGVEVNDVGNGSEFNFAHLAGADISRIEVLRGPQSARFGADTIGGVIGIFTNQAAEPGVKTHVNLESGSFKTHYGSAGLSVAQPHGDNLWTGQLNVSRMISDGYSASPLGNENDGFEDSSARCSLGYRWGDASLVKVTLSQTEIDAQGDEQDFDFPSTATQGLVIDADQNNASRQRFANLLLKTEYFGWQQQLSMSETKNRSRFFDTGTLVSGLNGERSKVDLQTSKLVEVGDFTHSLLIGAQYEGREFENIYPSISGADYAAKDRQQSLIGEYVLQAPSRSIALSFRADDNQRFNNATTARVTFSQNLPQNLRLHSSWGQGIANPTFFELFGFTPNSFTGNPNLQPEESTSWDLGLSGSLLSERVGFDLTYFSADLTNEIETVFDMATFTSSPANQSGNSQRHGWEMSMDAAINEQLSVTAHWNFLHSRDPDARVEVRRPEKSGSVSLHYASSNDQGRVSLQVLHNGKNQDSEFIFSTTQDRVTLASYTLVNLTASYDLKPNITLYLRGENLLDDDYQEVFGYQAPGVGVYAGLKARF
ncbi:TonB-dependent receptor [Pseudomonadales bacterium]|nr:TonB-dependent receptor [Pseudomonadales bacterium]